MRSEVLSQHPKARCAIDAFFFVGRIIDPQKRKNNVNSWQT